MATDPSKRRVVAVVHAYPFKYFNMRMTMASASFAYKHFTYDASDVRRVVENQEGPLAVGSIYLFLEASSEVSSVGVPSLTSKEAQQMASDFSQRHTIHKTVCQIASDVALISLGACNRPAPCVALLATSFALRHLQRTIDASIQGVNLVAAYAVGRASTQT